MSTALRNAGFPTSGPAESGGGPPHSKTQARCGGALMLRQVMECAAPAALWARVAKWSKPRLHLRRYRVTPRRNDSAFRREILSGVLHHLKHESTRTVNG